MIPMSVHRIVSADPYSCNMYLVKGRAAVLIDAGTGYDSKNTISQIWEALDGIRLKAVFLTHCHADHTGGLHDILEEFGCPAYISQSEARVLSEADRRVSFADGLGVDLKPADCKTFMPDDVFNLGDHVLEVVPTPGHTAGSVCFFDRRTSDLFSGDTVFANGYGRVDLPTGNYSDMCSSLRKLRKVNIRTLYPGHGQAAADGKRAVEEAISITEGSY